MGGRLRKDPSWQKRLSVKRPLRRGSRSLRRKGVEAHLLGCEAA
jgi:hypothetical protein